MPRRKDLHPTAYPGVYRVAPGSYLVRVKVIDPKTGRSKQKERMIEGVTSPSQAAAFREELRLELLARAPAPPQRVRLEDYARSWLDGKRKRIRRSTRERYASSLDLHLLSVLGDHYVDAIEREDLIAWRDNLKGEETSVNGHVRIMRTLFSDATVELDLPKNPAARVSTLPTKPVYSDEEPNSLTGGELRALLLAAERIAPVQYPVFATMALTGMRPGEALALRWSDIDEDAGLIRVQRSQYRAKAQDSTKTGKTRTVALAPELAAILSTHRQAMLLDQAPGLASGYVFVSNRTGGLRHTSSLRTPLQRACKAAEITKRFTPHGFRRTFNNLLRQVTDRVVQKSITGHSTDLMAEHYSHVRLDEKKAALNGVRGLVFASGADRGADPEG